MTPQQANELPELPEPFGSIDIYEDEYTQRSIDGFTADQMRGYALDYWNRRAPAPTSEPGARDAELIQLRAQNMLLADLYDAVAKLVKAKGRFHTEANYGALVASYDLVRTAEFPDLATPASPAEPAAPLAPSIAEFEANLRAAQKPLDADFSQILHDNLADLYVYDSPAPLVAQASPDLPTKDELWEQIRDTISCAENTMLDLPRNSAKRAYADSYQELDRIIDRLYRPAPEASPLVEDAQHFYTFTKPEGWINLQNPGQSWEQWTKTQGLPTTRGWKVLGPKPVAAQRIVAGKVGDAAKGHRDDWYLMANCRRLLSRAYARKPNWVIACELFATGATSAFAICRRAGIDPDSNKVERDRATTGNATADDGKDK